MNFVIYAKIQRMKKTSFSILLWLRLIIFKNTSIIVNRINKLRNKIKRMNPVSVVNVKIFQFKIPIKSSFKIIASLLALICFIKIVLMIGILRWKLTYPHKLDQKMKYLCKFNNFVPFASSTVISWYLIYSIFSFKHLLTEKINRIQRICI